MNGDALSVWPARTALGTFAVVAGPGGVRRVCFPGRDAQIVLESPGGRRGREPAGRGSVGALASGAAAQVEAWFSGERRTFTVPVDLGSIGGFRRRVLEAAAGIPFGETASYAEMAIAAGSPGAVRAAGTAMGANPVPILIPCHRVIRSDGTPGLYGGGEEVKRWLLALEGWAPGTRAAQDFPAGAGIT